MSRVTKREDFPSAVLETFDDGTGRVTFFNKEFHWGGDILLTKEQINDFYSEI